MPDAPLPPTVREVGIDLGLTHFAVLSDGRKIDNPRHARKAAAKLRRAQKELADASAGRRIGRSPAARSPAATPGIPPFTAGRTSSDQHVAADVAAPARRDNVVVTAVPAPRAGVASTLEPRHTDGTARNP